MITKHQINETLAGKQTKEDKMDFLEETQEDLFKELSKERMDQETHDELMDYTTNKAKVILKSK